MDLFRATALVTGADRGFGRAIAAELLARGATVYAGARTPASVDLPGAVPIALDVTDPASVAAAAEATGDVTLLVDNAGIDTSTNLLTGSLDAVRAELDVHHLGTLSVVGAFLPQLEQAGGSIVNVLSVLSWVSFPGTGACCAAKSAEWSMTNAVRVAALHVGYTDTGMTARVEAPTSDPADVARHAADSIAADSYEIVADETSRRVQARLSGGVGALYAGLPA